MVQSKSCGDQRWGRSPCTTYKSGGDATPPSVTLMCLMHSWKVLGGELPPMPLSLPKLKSMCCLWGKIFRGSISKLGKWDHCCWAIISRLPTHLARNLYSSFNLPLSAPCLHMYMTSSTLRQLIHT